MIEFSRERDRGVKLKKVLDSLYFLPGERCYKLVAAVNWYIYEKFWHLVAFDPNPQLLHNNAG